MDSAYRGYIMTMVNDEILNYVPQDRIISINEIIGASAAMYMKLILLSSIILFLYVIYTNWILGTRFDVLSKYNIDVHELAILPSVMLLGISAAYAGWI